LDPQEILILSAICKFINAKNICEIGTYDGNTALNLAANSPDDALITTIDLPPNWNGQFELDIPQPYINVQDRTKIGLQYKNTKYSHKIIPIFEDSAKINWGMNFPVSFDLVFIDGCHYYEYVNKDTQNALQHIKPGGLLIWHDYGMI
jgi:predicted O-methyltransferase YrrM